MTKEFSPRFELEQDIMTAWSIVDDLERLRSYRAANSMTEDQLDNYLLGLSTVYQVKFELLFARFEQMVRDKKIT